MHTFPAETAPPTHVLRIGISKRLNSSAKPCMIQLRFNSVTNTTIYCPDSTLNPLQIVLIQI